MSTDSNHRHVFSGRRSAWRGAGHIAVLIAIVLLPQTAYPIGLQQLLQLPLEQLLRLKITVSVKQRSPEPLQAPGSSGRSRS